MLPCGWLPASVLWGERTGRAEGPGGEGGGGRGLRQEGAVWTVENWIAYRLPKGTTIAQPTAMRHSVATTCAFLKGARNLLFELTFHDF